MKERICRREILATRRENASVVSAELPAILGKNLKRLRTRRGHSLERLAKLSGVSRAMLGQIETGKSTPTISLLWKVATALDVPFANLLAVEATRGTAVLRREAARVLSSSDGRFTSRALFPSEIERASNFLSCVLHRTIGRIARRTRPAPKKT